jgi:hypothetical protein
VERTEYPWINCKIDDYGGKWLGLNDLDKIGMADSIVSVHIGRRWYNVWLDYMRDGCEFGTGVKVCREEQNNMKNELAEWNFMTRREGVPWRAEQGEEWAVWTKLHEWTGSSNKHVLLWLISLSSALNDDSVRRLFKVGKCFRLYTWDCSNLLSSWQVTIPATCANMYFSCVKSFDVCYRSLRTSKAMNTLVANPLQTILFHCRVSRLSRVVDPHLNRIKALASRPVRCVEGSAFQFSRVTDLDFEYHACLFWHDVSVLSMTLVYCRLLHGRCTVRGCLYRFTCEPVGNSG